MHEAFSSPPPERVLERMLAVLRRRPSGLVTDVDGTIAPIVSLPEHARVDPRAQRALRRLRKRLDVVGVVTGRSIADARRLVSVARIAYFGNHGLESWHGRSARLHPDAEAWAPRLAQVLEACRERLTLTGLIFENKGATGCIHYRMASDPDDAREAVLAALREIPDAAALRIEEGRRVVNLLPPVRVTKGSAVRWLASRYDLRGLVFLGDDLTDAHAFSALRELRTTWDCATLGIGVVGPETPDEVCEHADVGLPAVDVVACVLERLAQELDRPGRSGDWMAPPAPERISREALSVAR